MYTDKDASKVQKGAAKAVKVLMDDERIGNKLMTESLVKAGVQITIQTVMNYTGSRRLPDVGILVAMLKVINNISGKKYTPTDIGLKIGPSFYSYD